MISRKFISKFIALIVGLLCLYVAYLHNSSNTYIYKGTAYGTTWSITTIDFLNDKHKTSIKKIISKIDYVASNYKEDSEVALLNNSKESEVYVSDYLFEILSLAKEIEELSNNSYDIKLGKVSSSLGFSPDFNKNLDHSRNSSYLLNRTNYSVTKNSDFWFDLSSIAKGYAVDLISEYLEENNFHNYIVEIGGELTLKGFNHKNDWNIAIQDPQSISSNPIYIVSNINVNKLSIATSGEYRNFKYNDDGSKISHTINPINYKSISNDILSVTTLSIHSAANADALATAFNVMGVEKGLAMANKNDLAVMFIIKSNDNLMRFIYSDKWYDLTK